MARSGTENPQRIAAGPSQPPRRKVAILGAAGGVGRAAVRILASQESVEFLLADLPSRLPVLAQLSIPEVRIVGLDVRDHEAVVNLIQGMDLVVLTAGPYSRTAGPVMTACLAAGVDYLDADDDVPSTCQALGLHEDAVRRGVALFKGCGAAPGLVNVYAAEAANALDHVRQLDTFWTSSIFEPGLGVAVLEHAVGLALEEVPVWRDSTWHRVAPMSLRIAMEIAEGVVVEMAAVPHPEPLMLARSYPGISASASFGALLPTPAMAILERLGGLISSGRITLAAAVEILGRIALGPDEVLDAVLAELGRLEPDRRAQTMRTQWPITGAGAPVAEGSIGAVAYGRLGDVGTRVFRRSGLARPRELWGATDQSTGRALAAFVALALESADRRLLGVAFPEQWAASPRLFDIIERHGAPRASLVEPLVIQPLGAAVPQAHRFC